MTEKNDSLPPEHNDLLKELLLLAVLFEKHGIEYVFVVAWRYICMECSDTQKTWTSCFWQALNNWSAQWDDD